MQSKAMRLQKQAYELHGLPAAWSASSIFLQNIMIARAFSAASHSGLCFVDKRVWLAWTWQQQQQHAQAVEASLTRGCLIVEDAACAASAASKGLSRLARPRLNSSTDRDRHEFA